MTAEHSPSKQCPWVATTTCDERNDDAELDGEPDEIPDVTRRP
jgi:hypothetical protein